MLNFTSKAHYKLKTEKPEIFMSIVRDFMADNEGLLQGFSCNKDFFVFTDRKLIHINFSGFGSKNLDVTVMPYLKFICINWKVHNKKTETRIEIICPNGDLKLEFENSNVAMLMCKALSDRLI